MNTSQTPPKEDWVRVLHSDTQITRNALFRAKDALLAGQIGDDAFHTLLKIHAHLTPALDEVTQKRIENWMNGGKASMTQPMRQQIVSQLFAAEEKRLGETEALLREFRDKPRP